MTTSHVVTFFFRRTFLSDRFTFPMAAEVMDCFTVMRIGRAPLVFRPAVAVIIIRGFLTGEALEAVGERRGVYGRPHIMEIDFFGASVVFKCNEEVDGAQSEEAHAHHPAGRDPTQRG